MPITVSVEPPRQSEGYRHIPRFGPYIDDELSVCMEKTLGRP
jgi:hypothetical protein